MARRQYNYTFPIVIPSFKANFVPGVLKDNGIWDNFPPAFQDKLMNHGWNDVSITKEDLDSLDNVTWGKVKSLVSQMT